MIAQQTYRDRMKLKSLYLKAFSESWRGLETEEHKAIVHLGF